MFHAYDPFASCQQILVDYLLISVGVPFSKT